MFRRNSCHIPSLLRSLKGTTSKKCTTPREEKTTQKKTTKNSTKGKNEKKKIKRKAQASPRLPPPPLRRPRLRPTPPRGHRHCRSLDAVGLIYSLDDAARIRHPRLRQ